MAIQSSFKQMCPSCEAMVPIRDPKLVGRKIDCPKCKYRFIVEEPADEVEEDEDEAPAKRGGTSKKPANGKAAKGPSQRRADDDEDVDDRPVKKQGGSGMLIVGIVLAAVAVVALAVGAVFLWPGDDPEDKPSGGPSANAPTPPDNNPPVVEKKQLDNAGPKPRVDDITNLLPNSTQVVVNLPLEHLLTNAKINQALLKTPGGFHEGAFKNVWGVPPTSVRRVVLSYDAGKKNSFSVMRTSVPVDEKQIVEGLKLKAEAPINGMKHYILKKPLDALSTFLLKGGEHHDKVALHFMDQFTVVCADVGAMNQFLQEKGQPKQQSNQPAEPEQAGGGGPGGGGPGAGGPGGGAPNVQQQMRMQDQMRQGGGRGGPPPAPGGNAPGGRGGPGGAGGPMVGGGGGFMPPGGMQPGMMPGSMAGGSTSAGAAPVSSSYLTIDPHLKAALDQAERVDKNENQNVLLSVGFSTSAISVEDVKKGMMKQGSNVPQMPDIGVKFALNAVKNQLKAVAAAVTEFSDARVVVNAAVGAKDADLAQDWHRQLTDLIPGFLTSSGVDLVAKETGNNAPGAQGNMMGGGMMGGGMMGGGMMGGGMAGGGGNMQMQRQMQQQRMMQQRMQGGGGGAMRGMQGGAGGPMGPMGPRGPMGPMGPMAPGGGAQPQAEGEKPEEKGKLGNYEIWTKESVLAGSVSLNLTPAQVGAAGMVMEWGGIWLRSVTAMTDRSSHLHELAAALQAYHEAKGHFPRGAAIRSPDAQRVLDWRPDQRLSWMTQILPYLANGEYKDFHFDEKHGWYDDPGHVKAGLAVIPQFVAPIKSDDPLYFYVTYPNLPIEGPTPGVWAATHFVGMAGVGLDAAEYADGDAATSKKRGVFNYNHETKKTDIKDGLDQTIVLIQVPPTPKSPWIAGGGSTVRGVSEDRDCVRPFVCTKYKNNDGKEVDGTFAIMADGKVRFIPATIDPKTFQAMCTIAGGDKIRNLDSVAPEVALEELPEEPELKANQPVPGGPQPQAQPNGGAGQAKVPAGWREIVSTEGRYRVAMPAGQVSDNTVKVQSPIGEVVAHIKTVALPGNAGNYMVQYTDSPGGQGVNDAESALEGFRNGLIGSLKGGRATNEKKITLAGRPGREFQVAVPGKGTLSVRVYLDKTRFYSLLAGGQPGKIAEKDIQTFFDSFQITGP